MQGEISLSCPEPIFGTPIRYQGLAGYEVKGSPCMSFITDIPGYSSVKMFSLIQSGKNRLVSHPNQKGYGKSFFDLLEPFLAQIWLSSPVIPYPFSEWGSYHTQKNNRDPFRCWAPSAYYLSFLRFWPSILPGGQYFFMEACN